MYLMRGSTCFIFTVNMPPSPSSGELWGHHLMPAQVEVSFFMPNGLFILMKIRRDASLQSIKHELWREAKSYPLHNLLMEPHLYIFVGVTQDGEREEFYDEMRRLCDLRLFQPILKLIEPAGNKDEKMFNSKLSEFHLKTFILKCFFTIK